MMMKLLFICFVFFCNVFANSYQALLFNGNCVTCHYKTQSLSAPSMVELRQRYLSAFPKEEDFVEYMSVWVQYPKKETSIMHDAIKKYELMPELGFDLETLKEISKYIYKTDFSSEKLD
jgi:cytochrome c551/c552